MKPSNFALWLACAILVEPCTVAAQPAKDAHGDPLPSGARVRLGTVRFRTIPDIGSLAMSADGKWLATGGFIQGGITLFDAATGVPHAVQDPRFFDVVAFSPDSRWLVGGHRDKIQFWDSAAFQRRKTLVRRDLPGAKERFAAIRSLAFSPDGKLLATGHTDHAITLWDTKTDKVLRHIEGHAGWVDQLAFSSDGKTLVSGSWDNTTRVWDVATGKCKRTIDESLLALAPDASMIATSSKRGRTVFLRRLDGSLIRKYDVEGAFILRGAFAKDGALLAVNVSDRDDWVHITKIQLFDPASGKLVRTLLDHANGAWPLMFAPDGKTVVSASKGTTGNVVRLWNAATGQRVQRLDGHENAVMSVAYAPDGEAIFTAGADTVVRSWNARTGASMGVFAGHTDRLWHMALAPDGKTLATESSDGTVRLWDVLKRQPRATLTFPKSHPQRVLFTRDGKRLIVGTTSGEFELFDVGTGKPQGILGKMPKEPTVIALSPDGATLAWGGYENDIRLLDANTGKERRKLKGHSFWLRGLAFSPDGRWLASASDDASARLWDLHSGASHVLYQDPETNQLHSVAAIAFSPDGALIASGHYDGQVRLWETLTRQQILLTVGHAAEVHALAFAPDGRSLVSGSYDTTSLIWDLPALCTASLSPPAANDKDWQSLWSDLGAADAKCAQRAVWTLACAPARALPLVAGQRQKFPAAAPKLDAARLAELCKALGSLAFAVRLKAKEELETLGVGAIPELEKNLKSETSLETRRRLEQIMQNLRERDEERRRTLHRVIQVLELIGSRPARDELERFAELGQERQAFAAARQRMAGRP